jgi:hypothetical protein
LTPEEGVWEEKRREKKLFAIWKRCAIVINYIE